MDGSLPPATTALSSSRSPLIPRPDRLYRRWLSRRRQGSIRPETLQTVLAHYGLSATDENTLAHVGRGESLILQTAAGKKVLKRYKSSVEAEGIRHEHSILAYVEQIRFPAPRLVTALDGATWVTTPDGQYYALFDYLEGYYHYHYYWLPPYRTRQYIFESGRALAALHDVLRHHSPQGHNPNGFQARSGKRWRELDWYMERLDWCQRRGKGRDDSDSRHLHVRLSPLETQLPEIDAALARADLPLLIIHGDFGPQNLLFKAGEPPVILDFELARFDWRLADLAKAAAPFAQNRLGFDSGKMNALLSGYQSVLPLMPGELNYLPLVWRFLAMRRAIVCAYRFFESGKTGWARQAEEKLRLADWVDNRRSTLNSVT